MNSSTSRRSFLQTVGLGTAAMGVSGSAVAGQQRKPIQGFEEARTDQENALVELAKALEQLAPPGPPRQPEQGDDGKGEEQDPPRVPECEQTPDAQNPGRPQHLKAVEEVKWAAPRNTSTCNVMPSMVVGTTF